MSICAQKLTKTVYFGVRPQNKTAIDYYLVERAHDLYRGGDQDRQRHCWVSCMSTKLHGGISTPIIAAGILKEIADISWHGIWEGKFWETIKDSALDMVANYYGIYGANFSQSCQSLCETCPTNRK